MAKIIDIWEKRKKLAELFKGVGVEVGVERAVFSKMICSRNPETKLYLVDPYKVYREYRDHVTQSKLDKFYEDANMKMANFPFSTFIKKFSMDAVKDFEDESLDFVYIDANHNYENVKNDITEWYKKVKKGGIVSGHDYIARKGQEHLYAVKRAVNDFVIKNNIKELLIWRGDDSPSWSFTK